MKTSFGVTGGDYFGDGSRDRWAELIQIESDGRTILLFRGLSKDASGEIVSS